MGVGEFFKTLAQTLGYALLIGAFATYVAFQEYFENLPRYIVLFGVLIVVCIAIGLILYRNSSRVRAAKREGVEEKIVHITPIDELKHDILALIVFAGVIVWVLFLGKGVNGVDIAQAGIAYLGVVLVRKIYRERQY